MCERLRPEGTLARVKAVRPLENSGGGGGTLGGLKLLCPRARVVDIDNLHRQCNCVPGRVCPPIQCCADCRALP